ncbi:MAG: putative porin [Paludibacteraceae bacterium]|nr:putative porin [Paludibacteraceae bacterium]
MKTKIYTWLLCWVLGLSIPMYAQNATSTKKTASGQSIKAWHVNEDFSAETSTIPDTLSAGFQITSTPAYINTIASEWLGNMGLPSQSAIFHQRHSTDMAGDFLFRHAYYDHYISTDRVYFFNTKRPYSNLSYATGGLTDHAEDHLTGRFSINATPDLNFGLFADYVYSWGTYDRQSTDNLNGYLNGSYKGEKYAISFIAGLNNFRNYENGGIDYNQDITVSDPYNVPTRLSSAWSIYRSFYFWVNQQYNIGYQKVDPDDSEISEFVPVMTIGYTAKFEKSTKKYLEKYITPGFYEQPNQFPNYSNVMSADSVGNYFFKNVVSFTLNEGFQKWAIFGLRAFAEIDMDKNRLLKADPDPISLNIDSVGNLKADSLYRHNTDVLVAVGGELFKRKGNTTYGVKGKVFLLGRTDYNPIEDKKTQKELAYEITGDFNSSWRIGSKDSTLRMYLNANGHIKSTQPSYFSEHYYSNHFAWENSFKNTFSAGAYGSIGIPYKYCDFSIGAGWQGLKNYIYFNHEALPTQDTQHFIQVISADVKLNLSAWLLHWDNQVSYQLSTNKDILPLPTLSLYSNFYLKALLFKHLTVQVGVDCRYNTAYYANAYMPATGQFYLQDKVKVGNYPLLNVYLNMHLKQFRFFVMFYNLSSAFMSPSYYTIPYYPLNPGIFKCGLSWNFYD